MSEHNIPQTLPITITHYQEIDSFRDSMEQFINARTPPPPTEDSGHVVVYIRYTYDHEDQA